MIPDEVRGELIDEVLHAQAGAWLIDAARAAETVGEAEAVLRYHLVGAMGGRHRRRWNGERPGIVVEGSDVRGVISWRELAEAARQHAAV